MTQPNDSTITSLQSHIRDLEQQIIEAKRVVNSLKIRGGELPIYTDSDFAVGDFAGSLTIKTDEFYGQKIHSAMRLYLQMRKAANLGPATLNEIYKALCDGGLHFESESEENRKTNMRFLLRKNTSIFHKLPDQIHFGLADWYPHAKQEDQNTSSKPHKKKRSRSKSERHEGPVKENLKKAEKAQKLPAHDGGTVQSEGITQEQAVRAATDAMPGDFVKQDIVDWIEKNHPEIQAARKRPSIFAMLAKLKDDVTMVKQGKGSEPSTYRRIEK